MGFGGSRAKVYDEDKPTTRFSDIAGYEGAKREVAEVVDFLSHPERYARAGAIGPRGVLMVGPPGTGKTLMARAVAGEAGRALPGPHRVELRRAVRRGGGVPGAGPLRRCPQAGPLDHLHRRDRRHRPAPGRLDRLQRRAGADPQPAPGRDGRLRPHHRGGGHGRHQPARGARSGPAPSRSLRPRGRDPPAQPGRAGRHPGRARARASIWPPTSTSTPWPGPPRDSRGRTWPT